MDITPKNPSSLIRIVPNSIPEYKQSRISIIQKLSEDKKWVFNEGGLNLNSLVGVNFIRVYNRQTVRKIHRKNIAISQEPNFRSRQSKIKLVIVGPRISVAK
jgi:hypothetical protein